MTMGFVYMILSECVLHLNLDRFPEQEKQSLKVRRKNYRGDSYGESKDAGKQEHHHI